MQEGEKDTYLKVDMKEYVESRTDYKFFKFIMEGIGRLIDVEYVGNHTFGDKTGNVFDTTKIDTTAVTKIISHSWVKWRASKNDQAMVTKQLEGENANDRWACLDRYRKLTCGIHTFFVMDSFIYA